MNSVSVIVLSTVMLVERTGIVVISHLKLPGGQVGEELRDPPPPENPGMGEGGPLGGQAI